MKDNLILNERADVGLVANRATVDRLNFKGVYHVEHWRGGKLLRAFDVPNLITNEGKNRALNVMFHAAPQLTTWYIGLIAGPTAVPAAADIYANIRTDASGGNNWSEFVDYVDHANSDSAITRPEWTEDAAGSQQISNSSQVLFNIVTSQPSPSVYGLFLCAGTNAQTKADHTSGSANCLWNAVAFTSGTVPVTNGDQLKVTYTVRA
ncbi:MAG: hypothetical protein ABFC88_12830 [Thermoguttaceae bacterium]